MTSETHCLKHVVFPLTLNWNDGVVVLGDELLVNDVHQDMVQLTEH